MIPVEFIKLKKAEKARHCCLLADLFFQERKRILITVQDKKQGEALDRYMWTWKKTSFIPHAFWVEGEECPDEPVLISIGQNQRDGATILVMACPCPVEFIRHFELAFDFAELYDPKFHEESRLRYVRYREAGLEPRMRQ